MSLRRFFVASFLVALVVAGVASYYASSHPDGLEFVAEKTGFLDSADDSPVADSPLADYSTKGIDDPRLSGGVAGVTGSVLVLALAGGLFWVLRGRGSTPTEAAPNQAAPNQAAPTETDTVEAPARSTPGT